MTACQETMVEKCHFNMILFLVFLFFMVNSFHSYEDVREEEGRISHMKKIPNNALLRHTFFLNNTSTSWCMVTSLGSCLVYT